MLRVKGKNTCIVKNNIWIKEKIKVTYVIEKVRRRKWTGTGHVSRIRDNRWTSRITTGNHTKRQGLEEDRRDDRETKLDELDDYWKGTIWQRIAQIRQMWKQHSDAFAQPRDIMTAQ